MPIETLRTEISELQTQIANWEDEIEVISHSIDCAMNDIEAKEAEIARLEAEAQRGDLITQLTEALADMSIDQLAGLVSSLQNGETPTIQPAPVVERGPTVTVETTVPDQLQAIDSEDVTYDMLTEAMHNAPITLVGVKYQDLWRVHHQIPTIGDRITLAKRDGIASQNTVGYTADGVSVGILPASDDKFAQLDRIGANSVSNRDVGLDHSIFDTEYEVVGVICGAFIFLQPVGAEETTESVEEQTPSSGPLSLDVLTGYASTPQEARALFTSQKPDHCIISEIEECDDNFIIHYDNHAANTMAGLHNAVIVQRSE